MNLSPNFSLEEMTVNSARLPNTPNNLALKSLILLCNKVLQPIRDEHGLVKVNSAYRSPEVNKFVGGAATSQHLYGEAADIECASISNADLFKWIVANLEFDQCIAERLQKNDGKAGWIHVSYRQGRNRKMAISSPKAGEYIAGLHFA